MSGPTFHLERVVPALRGYEATVNGVIGPSGTFHPQIEGEAETRAMLRQFAEGLKRMAPAEEFSGYRTTMTFVDFVRMVATQAADGTHGTFDERAVAIMVLSWIAAEALGATWEQVLPEGLS